LPRGERSIFFCADFHFRKTLTGDSRKNQLGIALQHHAVPALPPVSLKPAAV